MNALLGAPPSFFCTLCNISCSNGHALEAHYRGKQHQRRLNGNGAQHYCQLCNVPISGDKARQEHIAGDQHRSKLRQLGYAGGEVPLPASVPPVYGLAQPCVTQGDGGFPYTAHAQLPAFPSGDVSNCPFPTATYVSPPTTTAPTGPNFGADELRALVDKICTGQYGTSPLVRIEISPNSDRSGIDFEVKFHRSPPRKSRRHESRGRRRRYSSTSSDDSSSAR